MRPCNQNCKNLNKEKLPGIHNFDEVICFSPFFKTCGKKKSVAYVSGVAVGRVGIVCK